MADPNNYPRPRLVSYTYTNSYGENVTGMIYNTRN